MDSNSTTVQDISVDVLVVGAGTGMAAALAVHELVMSSLVVEKSSFVGGSTARSGGAFWIPGNTVLGKSGAEDSRERAREYVRSVVGESASADRGEKFLDFGAEAVEMLRRMTPMEFFWAAGYSDYHPERPGGSAVGRTCECKPFDAARLGADRGRLQPGVLDAPIPMPVTGADYKWLNLMTKTPSKAFPRILRRLVQGVGGLAFRREYVAGGQALAAGLFAGVLEAGIPVWTETSLERLVSENGRVVGAVVVHNGREVTVTARRGVVLAAGGFDHDMESRWKYQSPNLLDHGSLGARSNTGDGIRIAQEVGAGLESMDQAWWFPAIAPLPGSAPMVMLAERSLPGSFIVDQNGKRFINESTDYMSFGQRILDRERVADTVESMWIIFDQEYRNSYLFGGSLFPRQPLPESWYGAGIAHRATDPGGLARSVGLPENAFVDTFRDFNESAGRGNDDEFGRGRSAYDRYYGDPTVTPNPNLRALGNAPYYAVKMVLSDLGTCGGVRVDGHARVLREDGEVVDGLFAVGNTAANAFGHSYPGAGATIGQGLVFGYIAAQTVANSPETSTRRGRDSA